MSRRTVSLLAVTLLCAVGFATGGRPAAAHARTVQKTSPAKLLFSETWKGGLGKWTLISGKPSVVKGALTFDGSGQLQLQAPFQRALKNFAVVISATAAKPATTGFYDFGVYLRHGQDSRSGLSSQIRHETGITDGPALLWQDTLPNVEPAPSFTPGTARHTYRTEVHATNYRFLVDGHEVIPWTHIKSGFLAESNPLLGITITNIPVQVQSFQVYDLGAGHVAHPLATAPLEKPVLGASETTIKPQYGVFSDNAAYAHDTRASLSAIRGTGRLFGYRVEFQSPQQTITENLNLCSNPQGAAAAFGLAVTADRSSLSSSAGYHEVSTASLALGDKSFAFSYTISGSGGTTLHALAVAFQKGRFYGKVVVTSADEKVTSNGMQLAQKAVARLGT